VLLNIALLALDVASYPAQKLTSTHLPLRVLSSKELSSDVD
jgi:hypothetical protein